MTPFVASASRWRAALAVLLCLGFVALGVFLIRVVGDTGATIAGWLSIVTFGLFAAMGLKQVGASGPMIRVDEQGIWWRRWSDVTIPWSGIERIEIARSNGQDFLCLFLADPSRYPQKSAMRWLGGANRALGFGDIAVTALGTDRRFNDLAAAVERFSGFR